MATIGRVKKPPGGGWACSKSMIDGKAMFLSLVLNGVTDHAEDWTMQSQEPMMLFVGLIMVVLMLVAYFIPAMVAYSRDHNNSTAIFALNLLLGWSVLGWVAALVWSLTSAAKVVTANAENATPEEYVRCPDCKELIRHDAIKCRYCGCALALH